MFPIDRTLFSIQNITAMKFIFLFLLVIFSFKSSKAQPRVFQDSLAQFSYLLFGSTVLNKGTQPTKVHGRQGTGFFIKKNERIYFVTAKHTVTNRLSKYQLRSEFPAHYNIYSHYSDRFNFIPLPAVWRSDSTAEGLNSTDVFIRDITGQLKDFPVKPITLPKNNPTGSLDSQNTYDEIHLFGFPEKMNRIENGIIQIAPPYLFSTKNFIIGINFINQIGNEKGIDSLRYEIQIKDSKVSSAFGGFSGSPVFIRDSHGKWVFLGILVAINQIRNSIYVVKRDRVIKEITKAINDK